MLQGFLEVPSMLYSSPPLICKWRSAGTWLDTHCVSLSSFEASLALLVEH